VHSGGVCPTAANEGKINHAQCALGATFGAILTLLTTGGIITKEASIRRDLDNNYDSVYSVHDS
jgi:hypothetical protein